jgi:hypothetical protein
VTVSEKLVLEYTAELKQPCSSATSDPPYAAFNKNTNRYSTATMHHSPQILCNLSTSRSPSLQLIPLQPLCSHFTVSTALQNQTPTQKLSQLTLHLFTTPLTTYSNSRFYSTQLSLSFTASSFHVVTLCIIFNNFYSFLLQLQP